MSLQENSHQDPGRRGVSMTARGTAAMRAVENKREHPLVVDPYAELLAGAEGMALQKAPWWSQRLVDLLAIRTKWIDEMIRELPAKGIKQVVIMGSGLDSRVYRLKELAEITTYEVDFPEVFTVKNDTLKAAEVNPLGKLVQVGTDCSLPGWADDLKNAGYDPTETSFWLMEGFSGYLTEEEFRSLLGLVRKASSPKSELLATFNGTGMKRPEDTLHKFYTDEPGALMKELGWTHTDVKGLRELAEWCDRAENVPKKVPLYWLAYGQLPAEQAPKQ
eukprot:TRINITY_DN52989_c0_g1_i1.p1 TRINITY_DN52989_c0_g1~~TRINITY_DN52989_c0_g1_i1.p1  ORF type:complete len:287 (+),score=29.06 TRINITY_DN52989_c0_g1_i1:35-862(+)